MKLGLKISGIDFGILLTLNSHANSQINPSNEFLLTVLDVQNQVIPGAKCVLSQNQTTIAETISDDRGTATFANLAGGVYQLKIEK